MSRYIALTCAVVTWLAMPVCADNGGKATTKDVIVQATAAEEAAKYESQQTTIITKADIEKKQAKSVEDIIFNETGVSRTVDAMGRVGVSIRGAEPRHTLILVDGQRVMGDLAKYYGASDEVMRLGAENVDHIEVILLRILSSMKQAYLGRWTQWGASVYPFAVPNRAIR